MTTTTRNEAAERLLDRTPPDDAPIGIHYDLWTNGWDSAFDAIEQRLPTALAAERRATVARIREAIKTERKVWDYASTLYLERILDEEAAR